MKTIRNEHEHYLKTAYAKRHPYNVPATATGEVVYSKTTGFTITFGDDADTTRFAWASSPSPATLDPTTTSTTPDPNSTAIYLQDFMSLASVNGDTRLFMVYIHTTLSLALLSRAERNPNTHYGFGLRKKRAPAQTTTATATTDPDPANPTTTTAPDPTTYDEATYQKELALAKERYEKLLSLRPQPQCEQILEPSTKKME